jgi:hypothetical protein
MLFRSYRRYVLQYSTHRLMSQTDRLLEKVEVVRQSTAASRTTAAKFIALICCAGQYCHARRPAAAHLAVGRYTNARSLLSSNSTKPWFVMFSSPSRGTPDKV